LQTSGTGCGSDVALGTTTPPYVNAATTDFHLDSGKVGYSTALTAVSGAVGYPMTDIDGDTRPNPAAAGADQP